MPILKPEPALFPSDLFALGGTRDSSEYEPAGDILRISDARQWYVLQTKARQEKALARVLYHGEIPFYLPLVERCQIVNGRKRTTYWPLFSSYLFLYARNDERIQALQTKRIVGSLPHVSQCELWRELRAVRQLIESGAALAAGERWAPGKRVRVKHGTLAGLEGKVVSQRSGARLVVDLPVLQRTVAVEIKLQMLEAA